MDLVYNPHYEHPKSLTTDRPAITEQTQKMHGIKKKCKEQAYTMINMMKMEGKKIFHNTDQKVKVKLDCGATVNQMPTSVYKRINPQMSDDNGT